MSESLAFTLWTSLIFWPLYYVTFFLSNRKMMRGARMAGDEGVIPGESVWLLGISLMVAHLIAFFLAGFGIWMFPAGALDIMFWVGLVIMVLGMLLRLHCYRVLGRHFTPQVRVFPGHQVVTTGAYRLVRHPGYLATLSMMVGLGIALGSIPGLIVLLVMGIAVFTWRIRFEERALFVQLGSAYAEYARGKRRLIPFIF